MIHYHGGPLGRANQSHEFFRGRHSLISFQHRDELEIMAEVSHSFIFDNSSFSVWKSGKSLDVQGYYQWVDDWHKHPGFDWALIPDVIEGTEEENDRLIDEWPFNEGVPVWHLNESIGRIHRLAKDWNRIALGSTSGMNPGSKKYWARMAQVMDKVCDSAGRPVCKLHGLRMLNPDIFRHIPLASADSTNAVMWSFMPKDKFGIFAPRRESQRANVVADRVEAWNSASVWNPSKEITIQQEIQLCGQ